MGFRRHDLQVAFSVPGTYDLTVWGYSTTDPLDEVLRPGYLRGRQALVRPSDLVYICTRPGRDSVTGAREVGGTRTALAMVSACERGDASLRLVQDFGRPGDGGWGAGADDSPAAANNEASAVDGSPPAAATPAPPKRGRGRPPGTASLPGIVERLSSAAWPYG